MTVVKYPGHHWDSCDAGCTGCRYCDGGLKSCAVCNGAEACLPTDCPGKPMTEAQMDAVQRGHADYVAGTGWVSQAND